MFQLVHFMFDLLQVAKGSESRFVHCGARFKMHVLREESQLHSPRTHDIAAIRRLFTTDQPKNCRLASATPAHQTDMLAGIYLEGNAAQNIVRAVRFMNL